MSLKVVIVDDEAIERRALRFIIEQSISCLKVVEEAADGEEALHAALRWNPDIMTIDIKMPRIDGLQAIQNIKAEGLNPAFIIVSAYDTFRYAQTAIRLGVKDYLLKPSRRKVIEEVLVRVCSQIKEERFNKHIENLRVNKNEIIDKNNVYEHDPIQQAIDYIKKHIRENISLTEAAKAVGMHPHTLTKRMKEQIGLSFIEYVQRYRVEYAKQLVIDTNWSIKAIALSAGFKDPNYMNRVFRKITGQSPTSFRTQMKTLRDENRPERGEDSLDG